ADVRTPAPRPLVRSRACDQPPGQRAPLGCLPESTRLESGRSRGSQPCRPGGWWQAQEGLTIGCQLLCVARAVLAPSSDAEVRQLVRLVEAVLTLSIALLPATPVPDLDPREDPRHDHVAVEAGVLAEVLRDGDPALLVRRDLGGAGEERPGGVQLAPSPLRALPHPVCHFTELLRRIDGEATAPPPGHEGAARQLVAVLRGQDHPPFGIQGVLVLPEEHLAPSPVGCRPEDGGSLPRPPLRATLRPDPPQVNPLAPTRTLDGPRAHRVSPMVRAPHGRSVRRPAPLIRPSPGSPRCARPGSSTWVSAGRAGS